MLLHHHPKRSSPIHSHYSNNDLSSNCTYSDEFELIDSDHTLESDTLSIHTSQCSTLYSLRTRAFMPRCNNRRRIDFLYDLIRTFHQINGYIIRTRALSEIAVRFDLNEHMSLISSKVVFDRMQLQVSRVQKQLQRQLSNLQSIAIICSQAYNCPHCGEPSPNST